MKNAIKVLVIITFAVVIGFVLTGCGGGGSKTDDDLDGSIPVGKEPDNNKPGDEDSGIKVGGNPYKGNIRVVADGSYSELTTQLTFVFDQQLDSFTADKVTLSGVSGVTKGTVSNIGFGSASYYSGYRYVLPISGFTSSGSLTVKIGSTNNYVQIYYSTASAAEGGIYLGIIKFAGDAQALNLRDSYGYDGGSSSNNDAPILLTDSYTIQNVLNYQYQAASGSADGSAVYYAVHKALANLKSSENKFPEPDSVYIITFTDGKDNGSSGLSQISPIENQTFTTTAGYITYVQNQIATRTIQNKNITAYSIGVKGSDIVTPTDQTDFTSLLQNIAGSGNNKELDNYSDVQDTFDEIADGLIQGSNFTLSTTLLESGTKVRMTFDVTSTSATQEQITGSSKYIEGTVNITGSGASLTYTFTNITYGGITSDAGTGPLTGIRNGTQVNYLFSNITGYNYATDRLYAKQWLKAPGASEWTINSEYSLQNAVFGTAVIYLVLDCSSSISSNIYSIREAVNNFITKIYNARYNTGY